MNFFKYGISMQNYRVTKSRIARSAKIVGMSSAMILIILLIVPSQSLGLGDVRAKIVTNVSGLQNYDLHWNDRFPPGSTLMIYAEADDINHRRLVGVDYVFIIKDSNDNTIDTTAFSSRYQDYRSDDFIKFQMKIDDSLDDGTYVAEVHIFDLLNDSIAARHYENLSNSLLNYSTGDTLPDVPYLNRTDIMKDSNLMATQYKKVVQTFYVDKYANKYPANRFSIENMNLDMYVIAPGVPVQVNITAKNTFYDSGTVSMNLLLDGRIIDNFSSDIGSYGQRDFTFNIPTEITSLLNYGNHTLEIVPTSDNTVGLDLSTTLKVFQIQIEVPAKFIYSDIQIDKLRAEPNETVIVTVKIENKGRAGNQTIGLLINDVPVEQMVVHVNSLEKRDVNFSIAEQQAGEYRVAVNNTNLSKIFFIESNETVIQPSSPVVQEKQIPKIFIILVLLVLVILIQIIRIKFIPRNFSGKVKK